MAINQNLAKITEDKFSTEDLVSYNLVEILENLRHLNTKYENIKDSVELILIDLQDLRTNIEIKRFIVPNFIKRLFK